MGKLVGFKLLSFITMTIFSMSIYFSSLTHNFYSFLILYATVPGLMVGFGMTIPHYCTWQHFPARRKVLGTMYIVLSFASPAIPNILVHYSANPDNLAYNFTTKTFPPSVQENVP